MYFGFITIKNIIEINYNCNNMKDYNKIFKNKDLINYLKTFLNEVNLNECKLVEGSSFYVYEMNKEDFEKININPILKYYCIENLKENGRLIFETSPNNNYFLCLSTIDGLPLDNLIQHLIEENN